MKVLTADEARQLWPVLEPAITLALSRQGPPSPLFKSEVFTAIHNGYAHVLVGGDAKEYWKGCNARDIEGASCQWPQCPCWREGGIGVVFIDGDVCNLVAYEGTIREIKLLGSEMIRLAKAAGCCKIRWTGDKAWLRVVPGARVRCVVMELII